MVDRHAVFQRVRPAGVGRAVAADRTRRLARRVRREVIALCLHEFRQLQIDDAGINDGVAVTVVDLMNALHSRQRDHDAAAYGQAAARQARAGATRQERDVELVAPLDDLHDLLGRGREDDHIGLVLLDGVAVTFVDEQVAGGGEQGVAADDGAEAVDEAGGC